MALTFMKSQNEGLVVEVKALREELRKSWKKTLKLETDLKSATYLRDYLKSWTGDLEDSGGF